MADMMDSFEAETAPICPITPRAAEVIEHVDRAHWLEEDQLHWNKLQSLSALGTAEVLTMIQDRHHPIKDWPESDKALMVYMASTFELATIYAENLYYHSSDMGQSTKEKTDYLQRLKSWGYNWLKSVDKTNYITEIEEHLLPPTVSVEVGDAPILLSVPHDGQLTDIEGVGLLPNPSAQPPDTHARRLAAEIRDEFNRLTMLKPVAIYQNVHRRFITPQISAYFESQVFTEARRASTLRRRHPVIHLDIHGFTPTAQNGKFDIILGTGHRSTVGDSQIDRELARYMRSRNYKVYLPGKSHKPGERYTADAPHTLSQRVRSLSALSAISMQLGIARKYRGHDSADIGHQLAGDLAEFLATRIQALDAQSA